MAIKGALPLSDLNFKKRNKILIDKNLESQWHKAKLIITEILILFNRTCSSYHASHTYPTCSILIFIPPLIPRIIRVCFSFLALHFALHFSYYKKLLHPEFLDSNIL